jgi:hypothetical protein
MAGLNGTTFPYKEAKVMGILDRLKPQPRWKHADPAIRLEAVRELNDPVELAVLAETDPDAKVRRASVARTDDVATLARITAQDADDDTRDRATERLLAIALAPETDEATSLEAVRSISDQRRLSAIAKSEAADALRANALGRIDDARALGSIARHAKREVSALAALGRVNDTKELLETALNSDHKDVASSAFDRIAADAPGDLTLLRAIESRSQHKSVAKRARTMIQDIEAAEAARIAAEEARQRQQAALLESLAHVTETADADRAEADLARIVAAWGELSPDGAALVRFYEGRSAAEAVIADRRRQAEEAAERARLLAETLATQDALCARVETLEGEDTLEQLVPIEEEWRSLLSLVGDGPEADRLAARFAKAVTACRKRHELGAVVIETRPKLEALVVEAEGLLSLEDTAAAAARWPELSREARGFTAILEDGMRPAADLNDRLGSVRDAFAAREAAAQDAVRKAREEFATRLQRLAERAERAGAAEALTLREGERLMRDLSAGLDEGGRADAKEGKEGKDVQDACAKLRRLQETIAPRVRELREMDEWRRFANGEQQEKLIAMAEAIVMSLKSDMETDKESDLLATARALKELNAKWQDVAEAPRHSAQKLWERFRVATDFIRSRCEGFFSKMREERRANLEKKTALVEESEKLAESNDWVAAANRLRELQGEWQQSGPLPRDAARDLAQRFRTACNQFFSRRREDLTSRKKVWTDNMAAKEALCARAEELAESTEWDTASVEMKRLQIEWKAIGPVRRNKSEQIWQRFRTAADRFFERFHNRHQIALMNKLAEREALVVELEGFARADASEAPAELGARVQDLRASWNRGVPVPAAEMRPIAERWQAALTQVLRRWPTAFANTDLDPDIARQRMEKLVARVEAVAAEARERAVEDGRSQTEILAARLRSALASNAMGGRVSSEAKWRTAVDTVKDAQAAWLRVTPTPGPETDALESRFRDACRSVMDQARKHTADTRRGKPAERETAAAV